jgi:hypothetical protein
VGVINTAPLTAPLTAKEIEDLTQNVPMPIIYFDYLTPEQVTRFLKQEMGIETKGEIKNNLTHLTLNDLYTAKASQDNPLAPPPLEYLQALSSANKIDMDVLKQRIAETLHGYPEANSA